MAFAMLRSRTGITEHTKAALAGDSITITLGDVIGLATGSVGIVTNAAASTSGATVNLLGVVVGFTDSLQDVILTGTNPAAQTSVATGTAHTTYVVYQPTAGYEWLADLDAAAGTTASSVYEYYNVLSGTPGQLHEASVTNQGTPGQFLSFGTNPDNSKQVFGCFVTNFIQF